MKCYLVLLLSLAFLQASGSDSGLTATYYANDDFTGSSVTQIDSNIDFTWPAGIQPVSGIGPEFWSVVWTAKLLVPADGDYTFQTLSDDGIDVIIDGGEIISDWTGHAPTIDQGSLHLTTGAHQIEIRFFNGHLGAQAQLSWSSAGIPLSIIPSSAFVPYIPQAYVGNGVGLRARYYASNDFSGAPIERIDPTINFSWGSQPPVGGPPSWMMSATWTGWIEPEQTDDYRFDVECSGGVGLSIDGNQIINSLTRLVPEGASAVCHLIGGRKYQLELAMSQGVPSPYVHFRWSSALTPSSIVPQSQLFPDSEATDLALCITTPAETYVSPVWVSGKVGSGYTQLSAIVNGVGMSASHLSWREWFLHDDRHAFGVNVNPGWNSVVVTGSFHDDTCSVHRQIEWKSLDLSDLPYGVEGLLLRIGDTIRVTTSARGSSFVCDAGDGRSLYHVRPSDVIPLSYESAGTRTILGYVDGKPSGKLTVHVVNADLQGPIACQLQYNRNKTVSVEEQDFNNIVFCANDDNLLDVTNVHSTSSSVVGLCLRPLSTATPVLLARLGANSGPVIAGCPVNVFRLDTDADRSIGVISTEADGSVLVQADLTMTPLIQNLDLWLSIYAGGTTFADGSTKYHVSSNDLTLNVNGSGDYKYEMIGNINAYYCHTITIFQRGVQVGER